MKEELQVSISQYMDLILHYYTLFIIYFIIQYILLYSAYNTKILIVLFKKTIQGNCFCSVSFVALFTRYFSYFNISVKVSAYC